MLLQRTIRFGDKRAAEAMTPRVDVVGAARRRRPSPSCSTPRGETGHSRFPVYEETLDQVTGVVAVTDALGVPPARRRDHDGGRGRPRAGLVPESLDLDGVLAALRAADADLAIVVDEYGGTDGVVTIEDLVEELVGEIADEHDPDAVDETGAIELTVPGGERTFLVDGVLREDELAELTGFRLPEGPYETLAGFLMARLGHIPVAGETVVEDGWEFTVVEVDRRRVEQVRVVAAGGRRMTNLLVTVLLLLGNAFFVGARVRADRVAAHGHRADGGDVAAGPDGAVGDEPDPADDRRRAARHHDLLARPRRDRRAGARAPAGGAVPRGRAARRGACTRSRSCSPSASWSSCTRSSARWCRRTSRWPARRPSVLWLGPADAGVLHGDQAAAGRDEVGVAGRCCGSGGSRRPTR